MLDAAKTWPWVEAKAILERLEKHPSKKDYILLETGYGPSGLPHIGTFGEVARTTMVKHALERLTDQEVRLFTFSDDMDGLRKVPDNVPNQELLAANLGKPLTQVPDPFEQFPSFGEHNNAMLRRFLDHFGFRYEFISSTECYKTGCFNNALKRVLECFDAIMDVMLPTLGPDRRATYSPFLPICHVTGQVLQVPVLESDLQNHTITYRNPHNNEIITQSVTDGQCKLQWKVDWAMRWYALQVDYEMSGKDLIDSVKLSSQICRILGGEPPKTLIYELFLDEKGEKISKSKGNGLTIDEWLMYAPTESLAYYMFQAPQRAKRLYFDVIPKAVDEYLISCDKFHAQDIETQYDNPVWHIHNGRAPQIELGGLSFALLLNLASVCHAEDPEVMWGFVSKYCPVASPSTHPFLDHLIGYAVKYYQDFVKTNKKYRAPEQFEKVALTDLANELRKLPETAMVDTIQTLVFEVGKRHPFADLKSWFQCLYQVLLGQDQGPRFGSFIAVYGIKETINLIESQLEMVTPRLSAEG